MPIAGRGGGAAQRVCRSYHTAQETIRLLWSIAREEQAETSRQEWYWPTQWHLLRRWIWRRQNAPIGLLVARSARSQGIRYFRGVHQPRRSAEFYRDRRCAQRVLSGLYRRV